MTRLLSMDLGERIAVALSEGRTTCTAAWRFDLSVAAASGQGLAPGKRSGHGSLLLPDDEVT